MRFTYNVIGLMLSLTLSTPRGQSTLADDVSLAIP